MCVCVCVCVCEWVRGAQKRVCVIFNSRRLPAHIWYPSSLPGQMAITFQLWKSSLYKGKTETRWTKCSIPLIDSVSACVCVFVCVCVCVCVWCDEGWFSGVCHAQPILWKSLSRSTRPSLPGKACKWDEELYHFPGQVGTLLKAGQYWCQSGIKSGKAFFFSLFLFFLCVCVCESCFWVFLISASVWTFRM